jgi:hypothetical protein
MSVRFAVSRVMDTIEGRLTTDVALAQAVVDLGEVARFAELDGGRPVNLLRVGIAVDALSRYLVDAGAMLYGVAGRELLSEAVLTSKERMVLGRWADDGRIEVTPEVDDRAVEVADLTGLPLIAVRPYRQRYADRFPWLGDNPERVLLLTPRGGRAALSPPDVPDVPDAEGDGAAAVAVGKASVATTPEPAEAGEFPEVFATRGVQRVSRTRVVRRRFTRAEPSGLGVSLVAREWRCEQQGCPAFGETREIGQPVPRMRDGIATCPRHGDALRDVGARPASYAVSIVVDDLARRRFLVGSGAPVWVGVAGEGDGEGAGDGERAGAGAGRGHVGAGAVSVAEWAHEAAAAWIGGTHLRLEVRDGGLVVTDVSENGTVVWRRSGPDDAGESTWLHGESYTLGDWDTVELYTGIELVRGDRRLATTVGRSEPLSVLLEAPTIAVRQLS